MDSYVTRYDSPFGPITLQSDGQALTGLDFGDKLTTRGQTLQLFDKTKLELDEYFAGKRKVFTVPLSTKGSPFQQKVWNALLRIPYGETCSYADIALEIENPKAFRAVGMANNRNKIGIIIPCHRVIGKDGTLVGYAGGLEFKLALLDLEKRYR
ncbi:methylated-DNA--[protein]-cysteine S-methyltransferase [Sphaerochaeta sp. PS]|uniref:methylated-DNA--[protein]-cysteine S-methyltransferase n=1 Tax=Sphaerochaeta sp. PS TaxID=3076336 RepID=UPI0028A49163|nr:methylated-DNA--[protein]-cysteine S-methyltransferase [Sphaerochaeta sp. PS]MDT4761542.1 methylated-DNA--[protein]-cysteine S-methyltransferase [Sphaerochaeta sp. PS]